MSGLAKGFAAALCASVILGCGDDENGSTGAPAADAGSGGSASDPFAGLAETIEQERIDWGIPGAAFAVLQGDEVTFSAGFGHRTRYLVPPDAGSSDDVQPTTLFRIGSVTKQLTATALLRLVQAGIGDLDAPIIEVVPELNLGAADPSWVSGITLRHVLSHTSGISDGSPCCGDEDDRSAEQYWTGDDRLSAPNLRQLAPAGRLFNYSNSGYSLASLVLERLSGKTFPEAMRDEVFEPLGMDRTFFLPEEVQADGDFAYGESTNAEGVGPGDVEPEVTYGAAFAWSSVLDLARFARFLMDGDESVLGSSFHEELMKEQAETRQDYDVTSTADVSILLDTPPPVIPGHYGFGLFTQGGVYLREPGTFHETPVWSHTGGTRGFITNFIVLPASRTAFISLANLDTSARSVFPESHAYALEHLGGLPPATPPIFPTIDREAFTSYAGEYVDLQNPGWTLTVAEEAGELTMTTTDPSASFQRELVAVLPGYFLRVADGGAPWEITFFPGPDGAVEYVRINRSIAVPVSAPAAAAARAAAGM